MTKNGLAGRLHSLLVAVGLSLGAAVATAPFVTAAHAATPVETFVQQSINQGITILKNKALDDAQRRGQVRDLLLRLLDAKKVGLFALGPARDGASQADLDAYVDAFKDFTVASYESRLGGYDGQALKITASVQRAPGDYLVTATLVDPADPKDTNPLQIVFRVLDEGGKFALVDASIAGVWMGLAQRDDFGGFLAQHGENVPALTVHLQEMTAQLNAAKPAQ